VIGKINSGLHSDVPVPKWLATFCLLAAALVAIVGTCFVPSIRGAAAAPPPSEYAVVTTGCTQASTFSGGALAVTVYNAPDGNLVATATVAGIFPNSKPPGTEQFQATQFHSPQPVLLGLIQGAAPNTSVSVSYSWTDATGAVHTLSPNPTVIEAPNCGYGNIPGPLPQLSYTSLLSNASGSGYYILGNTGLVLTFASNNLSSDGTFEEEDLSNTELNAPVVGMARGPTDHFGNTLGYWIATADGGVFSFGGFTPFYGSAGAIHLNKPIVGIASTSTSTSMSTADGYWLVASDGGVFAFGSAQFYGSTGNIHLNSPIVGIAPTPDNLGYYLVAADGGVFAFGDARFQGSMGSTHLNQPVVGMQVDQATGGYWLAASDGGVFSFDAPFLGSTGNIRLNQPIVGFAASPSGQGYWFMGADSGIFSFGNAPFYGTGVPSGGPE
jgi:hypothetical protein